MKIGGRISNMAGFTIIETLIVLAVSGILLTSAAVLIGGKQGQTEFNQGTRDVASRLQQIIDDVSNGYYQNNGAINCHNAGNAPVVIKQTTAEGTNQDCIFLGKVIQFGVKVGGAIPDPEPFNVYTVVGVRENNGNVVETLADANPRLITLAGTYDVEKLPYGMTTMSVKSVDNSRGTLAVGAVGILSNIGYINDQGVTVSTQGPTQQVDVYPIGGTSLGQDLGTAQPIIESQSNPLQGLVNAGMGSNTTVDPSNGVQICMKSGTTSNQYVLYTIGGQGRQLSVATEVKSRADCS